MFISAVFKFKQYKDNSTGNSYWYSICLFGISVVLIFLPGLYSQTGFTIFGDAKVLVFTELIYFTLAVKP